MAKLQNPLKFQSFWAELSAGFLKVPFDNVDQQLQVGLVHIAENMDIDYARLGVAAEDNKDIYASFTYATAGTKPWEGSSLLAAGPYLATRLLSGQPVISMSCLTWLQLNKPAWNAWI
ncbi:hypothetical protein [Methylomonas rosea]|uniref:Uncharacterized protein n=1 Tax=Methylomonas rosea TaxID=2952227 RepID=A0ABT1TPM5_9GAMM|nr:hypothetical protein [Methylomonas sp. WSC-7]MCQ8116727.1 hypothetical protein [Methylomonas sp. WSC-7]